MSRWPLAAFYLGNVCQFWMQDEARAWPEYKEFTVGGKKKFLEIVWSWNGNLEISGALNAQRWFFPIIHLLSQRAHERLGSIFKIADWNLLWSHSSWETESVSRRSICFKHTASLSQRHLPNSEKAWDGDYRGKFKTVKRQTNGLIVSTGKIGLAETC